MKATNVLFLLFWTCVIMAAVVLISPRDSQGPSELHTESYYPEVVYMVHNDSIMAIHALFGIDTITSSDWEETANALGISPGVMTIDMYMHYLQMDDQSRQAYDR